jgi:hypothetical protein
MSLRLDSSLENGPMAERRLWHRGARPALLAAALAIVLPASAQAATVGLGTADSAAVLAGSTVTNTGPSVISGDVGVYPGTVVSGFPPGLVLGGTIHAADGVAMKAKADLTTAYDDAAGRSSGDTISADLAGSTLTPGVYTSATSLGLSGDLTLDAQGDPDAVFVFQAGSTLTAGSGSRVLVVNGAQSCNVFWQVGSSATIGSDSAFAGNILALTSISLTTGATLNGRALARNGAVTLDSNLVTKATCATPPSPPPSANDTSATTAAGHPVTVVLDGTDASGAPLTYEITGSPSNGALGPINQSDGTVTYTPTAGYAGTDSFTYAANSSNGASNDATASIAISPAGVAGGAQPAPGPGSAASPAAAGAGAQPPPLAQGSQATPGAPAQRRPPTAELRGPSRCVHTAFRARVSGHGIAQVRFYLDGRWRRTITAKAGQTVFSVLTYPRGRGSGVHHVTAKVRFKRAGTKIRTLRMVYQRCGSATVAPRFTG